MTTNTNLDELLKEAKTLIKLKDFDKAIPIYEAILKINDMHPDALSHLSIIFLIQKRYQDAIDMIHKSLQIIEPVIGDYQNLAMAYLALKDYKNAISSYEKAIEINPNLFELYKLMGDAQMEIVDHLGAFDSYGKALKLEPEKFQQLYDYGATLHVLKKHEEAMNYLLKANKVDSDHIECLNKIAACLSAIGNYKEAKVIYKKLMKLVPEATAPKIDFAACLIFEGKYEEPVELLEKVLIQKPYQNIARNNLSVLQLSRKEFQKGWQNYEARIAMRNDVDVTKRTDKLKTFIDIDIGENKLKPDDKILILLDAGIGDVIICLSMLEDFHQKFKYISAEVDYRLVNLFKRSFPDIEFLAIKENKHEILYDYDLSLFDKGIYWGSLGKYVRQKISDFPEKNNIFLKPDDNKINEIRNQIRNGKDKVCGISWKSTAHEGRHKSTSLENLISIFSVKGIRFIDLQYETKSNQGQTALEKEKLLKNYNFKIDEYDGIDKFQDIDDLTALIKNCDFIVTASNVTAHMAGALGIKTFLFVPYQRGRLWYWHQEEGQSLWYPSLRIFRAESVNEWGNVFKRIADEIKKELA